MNNKLEDAKVGYNLTIAKGNGVVAQFTKIGTYRWVIIITILSQLRKSFVHEFSKICTKMEAIDLYENLSNKQKLEL